MGAEDLLNVADDNYKFSGSDDLAAFAESELRETESLRNTSLQQLREAINKHPDIKKCRTDSLFLLRFLRTKKFSVPLALEMLERYLVIRQLYPHWFRDLDVNETTVNEILDAGYIIPLPVRDEQGRQVLMTCPGRFDPYKYTAADMARVHSVVVETLMDNEENQIRGYTYINDESGLLMGHLSLWSLSEIRIMIKCIQNTTPVRHKATHFVNLPVYATKVFEFFTGLLNEKLKARITLHNNMDEFKQRLGTKILPKEYGGEVPLSDMIAQFKLVLKQNQDSIAALNHMEIDLTNKKKFVDFEDDLAGVSGSFRKLEVD